MAIPVSLAEGQASEKTRSLIVRGILIFGIIVNLGSVILYNARVGLIDALQQGVATQEQAEGSDAVVALIALIQLAVYVTTVISWLMWQYRAYTNLKVVGSGETDYTPAWSVGYWFIPFLNIVRSIQVTSELWRRSEQSNASLSVAGGTPPLVGAWWICWIVSNVISRIAARGNNSDSLDTLRTVTQATMFSEVVSIAAAILAIVMISKISQMQQTMRAAQPASAPPPPSYYSANL